MRTDTRPRIAPVMELAEKIAKKTLRRGETMTAVDFCESAIRARDAQIIAWCKREITNLPRDSGGVFADEPTGELIAYEGLIAVLRLQLEAK